MPQRSDSSFSPDDEALLLTYLDGELNPAEAAQVEARLASDPEFRKRADEYQKTFDMLDYLPEPEPDPEFANRTVTLVAPAWNPSQQNHPVPSSRPSVPTATFPPYPVPVPAVSSRVELMLWALALVVAGVGAFFAHHALRPIIEPVNRESEPTAGEIVMIESLPLYLGVDDFEFARKLQESDLFEPRDSLSPDTRNGNEPLVKPNTRERDLLLTLFKSFSPARQDQIRQLHQQIQQLDPAARQQMLTILGEYSIWLDRLPDGYRKEVLNARDSQDRLDVIIRIKERIWRNQLPVPQQEQIKKTADIEEQLQLTKVIRDRADARQSEWIFAQRQWQQLTGANRKPWPFNDPELSKEIDAYVKNTLGADLSGPEPKITLLASSCRLNREEFLELRASHDAAHKEGYWFSYGASLLRLAEKHPSLPKPKTEASIIVRPSQLPPEWLRMLPKEGKRGRLDGTLGRWPDFALEIHRIVGRAESRLPPLGPSRLEELDAEVEEFTRKILTPKLTSEQAKRLRDSEGKWPQFSQEIMTLSREHNLAVPKVSLPGPPREWDKYYKLKSIRKTS